MSGASSIEWTDATWNPVRGCSRVSEGCRNCYAERMAARFSDDGFRFHGIAEQTKAGARWTGKVELIPSALDWPLRKRKPLRIFVNSMSDLFHERLSDEDIAAVFGVMAACPQHTFQVLTKRPERMANLLGSGLDNFEELVSEAACNVTRGDHPGLVELPLPNVWLGVSVENQATADERIPLLLQTPAAVRFVSYEPALGAVDFRPFIHHEPDPDICLPECEGCPHGSGEEFGWGIPAIDWLIVGGESGPGARPFDLEWARSVVAQCKAAEVPVFVKQLGRQPLDTTNSPLDPTVPRLIALRDRKGGDWSEWPEDIRVREFPT